MADRDFLQAQIKLMDGLVSQSETRLSKLINEQQKEMNTPLPSLDNSAIEQQGQLLEDEGEKLNQEMVTKVNKLIQKDNKLLQSKINNALRKM